MRIGTLFHSSTFRLTLIYMAVFCASVLALLGFIYWSTAAYMARQVDSTIDAEIEGLAERYESDGLPGLLGQIAERLGRRKPGESSVYLVTDQRFRPLLGNVDRWPQVERDENGWMTFLLGDDMGGRPHRARARAFIVGPGHRLLVGQDMFELEETQTLIKRALVSGMAITLALGLVGGAMISRSVMGRIEAINRTSREIMSGNLRLRVPNRNRGDEFDQLANNLNRMLDQIELLMDGVRRVSDNIAHDLKTPLARLRNRLEALRRASTDQTAEEVDSALAEADGLLSTFNALLRIARIEAQSRKAGFDEVDIRQLLLDVIELYEPLADERQITLQVADPPQLELSGDRDLLFQALANLVDNAIKYTPARGVVQVRLTREEVSVCDSGPGIPAAEWDRVVQRFYRLDHSRTTPGSGLGLSLVKAVAVLHDMELSFRDNRPGLCVSLRFAGRVDTARNGYMDS